MFKGLKKIAIVLFWAAVVFLAFNHNTAAIDLHNMIFNFIHTVEIIATGTANPQLPAIRP